MTAAVLGLNDRGLRLLKAAAATGCFAIKAVADLDPQKAEKTAAEYHCDAFSDYRQLIVQNQLDCLLVAAEPHTCDEHLKAALKKKFHVLRTAPPARTFEELLQYVRLAEAESVQFAVANPARFQGSFQAAHEILAQGRLEQPFLLTAAGSFCAADRSGWRADPNLAGGGVLLHDCYALVDQLFWSFPLPEQVYALKATQAPDKQQRLYLTEDTALVSLRFSDALMGSLTATRRNEIGLRPGGVSAGLAEGGLRPDGAGPHRVSFEVHAKEARLTVTENQVELRTRDGHNDLKWQYDEDELGPTSRLLTGFALSVRNPQEHPFTGGGSEQLRNMAVLESAYLSARTGFPEQPARILQLAGKAPPGQDFALGVPTPPLRGQGLDSGRPAEQMVSHKLKTPGDTP